MNERAERAVQDFVINLTGTDYSEIQRYNSEIISNAEFNNQLEDNKTNYRRRGLSSTSIYVYSLVLILIRP